MLRIGKYHEYSANKFSFFSLLEELKHLDSPTCQIKKVGHLAWDLVFTTIFQHFE